MEAAVREATVEAVREPTEATVAEAGSGEERVRLCRPTLVVSKRPELEPDVAVWQLCVSQ